MPDDHHLITDGATIAYQLSGPPNTVPVGYGHGVLMSRQIVRGLGIFDIDAIADRRRLITYDQRGHGASRGRPEPEDYRFEQAANDLLRVLDAAGLDEPIDFAGPSLGAGAALHAALNTPRRFRRLALVIPPVAWETGPTNCASGTSTPLTSSTPLAQPRGDNSGPTLPHCRSSPTTRKASFNPASTTMWSPPRCAGSAPPIYPTPIG